MNKTLILVIMCRSIHSHVRTSDICPANTTLRNSVDADADADAGPTLNQNCFNVSCLLDV